MKIRNEAARIIHLNCGPHGIVSIAPLQEVELTGEQEKAARALLDAALKPHVDDGSLVIDGAAKPRTSPNAGGPSNPTQPQTLASNAPGGIAGAAATPSNAPPDTDTTTSGSSRKRS
jgi:hypothetical protein